MGLARRSIIFALAACLSSAAASAATRYDPRLRFRTLSTARFDIHFHQGVDALARRLAGFVEEAAATVDAAIGPPQGRVQIILLAQHDLSNGWATPVPYNTIEISAAAPEAESLIGNAHDWLRLVFVHEYTHIAHLSRAEGWIGGLRRGFGRLPLLFPNLYQPIWGIEGLATWQESAATGSGRVPAGDFRLLLQRAAAEDRFEPLDRVNGGSVDWPAGTGPYLYGAYFHSYLAERYGTASLRALVGETSRRVPYVGSRAYLKVFGRSLGDLWQDFEASTRAAVAPPVESSAVRLTHHGFDVSGPRFGTDNRIFYSAATPHHFPALMEIGGPATAPRRIAGRFLGNRIAPAGDLLLVDEIDLVRSVALQSDLFFVNPRTGERTRVTREARALDPDVSSSRTVVCAVQLTDRRALATFPLPRPGEVRSPQILISDAETSFSAPRWSPDGRLIAAERRIAGGPSEIVIVDPADRAVRRLASLSGGRNASPVWTPDGARVIFSAALPGEPFRLYAVDVASGGLFALEGAGATARSADISPDGSLVFVGYTSEGYDLFSVTPAQARWTPIAPGPGATTAVSHGLDRLERSRIDAAAYSPWRTLAPRFWTPTVESDSGEVVAGAATGSLDALGRHAYAVEAGWGGRARPDWQALYAYDRWRPTFFASISDDTDPWRGGELRTVEGDVGMLLRFARVRSSQSTLAAFHVSTDTVDCPPCEPGTSRRSRRAAVRGGWEFNNSRAFGYSISAEEGGRLSTTLETTREALGADGDGLAATLDGRRYWRVSARHATVALRGAAAGSWGDPEARRVFSASGSGPQPGGFGFGRDAIGLLRGVAEGDVAGTRAVVVNLDFRFPLVRVDRGVGTIPLFVRNVHGAVFADAGHAWTEHPRWSDSRTSIGAEVSIDTVVGFVLPVTLTAGGAWQRDGAHGDRGFVSFARIGRAF
jgi:hypothetical protein